LLVIAVWMGQPLLIRSDRPLPGTELIPFLAGPIGLFAGLAMMVAGYTGTLWCYAAMGDTWRIGINRQEKTTLVTRGPYRRIRHPIYFFQMVMLAGAALHLPTPASLAALVIHFVCVLIKAVDEESYLLTIHGAEYRDHIRRTGRLWPGLP
jgi:protein-S-isoprenylcysteine O-methyltransferase Ste14